MIDEVCPSLTWKQRLIGFAICAGCGYLVSFGSFIRIRYCINGDCVGFALGYTFGGVIALCATFFLMGPCKQLSRMFDEKRRIATIVLLTMMVATLCVSLIPG